MKTWVSRFVRDESGQGTVEYVLILAAAVAGAVALSKGMLGVIDRGVLRFGGQLEKDLKSGRAPVAIWKN